MSIKVYHRECGPRAGNFGDAINPLILQSVLGHPVKAVIEFEQADIIAIGSIVQDIPASYPGIVWGTGLMFGYKQPRLLNAKLLALRGPMTAHRLGITSEWLGVFGDPGLLADRLVTQSEKRYRVGIVPHYVDYDNPAVHLFAKRFSHVKVIDPCQHPLVVLREISSCETIVSSSLHGMITAHSFGIPATWTILSDQVQGGVFKFQDYLAAAGVTDALPLMFDIGIDADELADRIRQAPLPDWSGTKEKLAAALKAAF